MDETIRRYGFAAWAPGGEWGYSNLAFGILGDITERAAGEPWRTFMDREVYDALGMKRTSDRVRPGFEKDAAAPYDLDAAGRFVRVAPYDFDHPGASAMWSTANDLARFVLAHLNDGAGLLKPETAREMRRQTSKRADGGGTGVGWAVATYFGKPGFGHSGGMPGVSTLVACYPETRSATIVLTNTSRRTLTNELSKRLAAVLFPDAKPASSQGSGAPSGRLKELEGTFTGTLSHFDGDIPVTLTVKGDDSVTIRLAAETHTLGKTTFSGNRLSGECEARLRVAEGYHGVPSLRLSLMLEGNRLTGVCMARAEGYFCLSHWVELERRQAND
jgi:CubicO group peptidase (beta-lactamase class C family)